MEIVIAAVVLAAGLLGGASLLSRRAPALAGSRANGKPPPAAAPAPGPRPRTPPRPRRRTRARPRAQHRRRPQGAADRDGAAGGAPAVQGGRAGSAARVARQ